MELKKVIESIEKIVNNNLNLEYNTQDAYIAIDDVVYSILDTDSLFWSLTIRYSVKKGAQKTFLLPAIIGLPDDFSKFSKQDIFALALVITNLVADLVDSEAEEESLDPIESKSKYYC